MTCPNCGVNNIEGGSFCIKCGMNLTGIIQTMNPTPIKNLEQNYVNQPIDNYSNRLNDNQPINNNLKSIMDFNDYFSTIVAVLIKPYTAFKSKINQFDNLKNSAILAGMVAIIAMLLNLIITIINTVRVTTGGLLSKAKTKWVWENIKEIEFIKVIGTNLLIFLGIIAVIVCVYYLASLIIKKQTNFSKVLGIAAISVVPMFLSSILLSPLLSMISTYLGTGIKMVGSVYTLLILYETINNEMISLKGNTKYYFNLICLSIIIIVGYYLYMKVIMGGLSSDIGSLLDLFN